MAAASRHRLPTQRTCRIVALGMAAVVTGCSGQAPAAPSAAPPAPPVEVLTSADIVGWDDGLSHVVVTLLPGAAAAVVDASSTAPTDSVAPGRAWTRVVDRPPTGLTAVEAVTPAEIEALADAGPGSVIVVDTDGLVGDPGRRYLRSLGSLFEVEPSAAQAGTEAPAPAPGDPLAGTDGLATLISGIDGVVRAEVVGTGVIAVATSPDAEDTVVDRIGAIDGVADVDEDVLFGLHDDPRQGEQWALQNTGAPAQADGHPGIAGVDIGAADAWTVSEGAGTVVAVIDSGVDLAHPDLASAIWSNPGELCGNGLDDDANGFVDDCRGWDFGDRDADPNPSAGSTGWYHGTHVAGIVAAARNGTGVVGVAPQATILPLKVSDSAGRLSLASIAAAIDYAAAHADVINLSLGTSPGVPREYVTGLEAAIARAGAAGVTVVAAMGNDGVDISARPVWPASYASLYDHVIAVGASTNSDSRASFSNTGSPLTLYAPGWAIMSTMPQASWGFLYGTSMATPVVAGAAAAVRSAGVASTPAAIRSRLVATSVAASAGRRLDLAAAVGYVPPTEQPEVSVSLVGADRVVADTPAELEWVVATRDTTGASLARLSVAARDTSGIGAVDGLDVQITGGDGTAVDAVTDARGELPLVALDGVALAAGGASLTATVSLPAAEYAFVVELLDAAGQPVAPPVATFLSVVAPGGVVAPGTVPAPVPTTLPGGAPGSPPTTGGSIATTIPPGAAPTTSPATSPTTPGTTPGGGAPLWPTTTPATTVPGAPPTTGAPVATTVPDRAVPTTVPTTVTTNAPTTVAPATTSAPASPAPATTAPTVGPTTSTLPPPAPDSDGTYRATSISPRSGPLGGGTVVTIEGSFPASVPVYVWFGDSWSTAVRSAADTTRLTVTTPAAVSTGVRDVVVRFATDRSVELRLERGFEYVADAPPTGSPTPPGTATPITATPITATPITAVPGTPAPTTVPATTAPVTTAPATTAPTTTGAPPATTVTSSVAPSRALGRLTLRPPAAGSALASIPSAAWPSAGCRAATCSGTVI